MEKLLCCAAISILLAGCGSSSSSNSSNTESTGSIDIAGIYEWDSSEDGDEGYTHLASNGETSIYDYAGDSFDNYANCYWISKNESQLTHNGGNSYTETYQEEDDLTGGLITVEQPLTMVRTSNGLRVSGIDVHDGEPFEQVFVRANINLSDLTPDCDE